MTHNTVNTPVMDCNEVFATLETWIKQRPGLDPADYGCAREQQTGADGRFNSHGYAEAMKAYRAEIRQIGKDRARAMKALDEARALEPARPEILKDAFRAFSGRLEWKPGTLPAFADEDYTCPCGIYVHPTRKSSAAIHISNCPCVGHLEYCTGQYWPTEYRPAAAAVLEAYIAGWRQAYAAEHPRTFEYKTMEDVIAANRAIGNHWFDVSSMRFFKTRIESGLIAGHRFITSEKGPDNVRKYTVREACPDGTIDTVGEFQAYRTRDEARAAVQRYSGRSTQNHE